MASSSCGVFSLELGGIPGLSGPRCPLWKDDVSCSGSESTLGCEVDEHNNECWAIEVIGEDWSSEVVALFLEDWELGRVALSCHMAMDLLCKEMRDVGIARSRWALRVRCVRSAWILSEKTGRVESLESQLSQQALLSHRGRAVKGEECGERIGVTKECERQAEVSKGL